KALRVASRTSSFAFKGKTEDIGEVGRKLKVHTVLEGSVRKAGNRLRVTAQLIDVAEGYHLWSERYDRQLEDIFAIQGEIAENSVRALRVVLGEDKKRAIEKAPTENVQAYEYYLRGRQFFHQLRRTTLQYARRMFDRAIEIDPNFARAHAGIADCCSFLYMYWDGSKANLEGADASSRKALELDPESAEAHTSRGLALTLHGRYQEALEAEQQTLKAADAHLDLNPDDARAWYFSAGVLMRLGQRDQALERARRASMIDPEDPAVLYNVGCVYALGGCAEEALDHLDKAIQNGFGHRDWLENDSDLDSIRDQPRFQALLRK